MKDVIYLLKDKIEDLKQKNSFSETCIKERPDGYFVKGAKQNNTDRKNFISQLEKAIKILNV